MKEFTVIAGRNLVLTLLLLLLTLLHSFLVLKQIPDVLRNPAVIVLQLTVIVCNCAVIPFDL